MKAPPAACLRQTPPPRRPVAHAHICATICAAVGSRPGTQPAGPHRAGWALEAVEHRTQRPVIGNGICSTTGLWPAPRCNAAPGSLSLGSGGTPSRRGSDNPPPELAGGQWSASQSILPSVPSHHDLARGKAVHSRSASLYAVWPARSLPPSYHLCAAQQGGLS